MDNNDVKMDLMSKIKAGSYILSTDEVANDIYEKIIEILATLTPRKIDGLPGLWFNIAPLGKKMKDKGITYQGKLKEFMEKMPSIELHEDRRNSIPVSYIRILDRDIVTESQAKKDFKRNNSARNAMLEWAYWGKYSEVLTRLKNKSLDESWSFSHEPEGQYSILDSYLRYTFFRIQRENKICYTKDEQWAIFNTGLVNNTYLPIYALFNRNRYKERQPWYFVDFIAEGEKSKIGHKSNIDFTSRPQRAQYFDDPTELLYIVSESTNELSPNYEHIITDNVERLPIALLKDLVNESIEEKKQRIEFSSEEDYHAYLLKYKSELKALIADRGIKRKLQERFRNAIDVTRKRVLWNYKTAIPTYYPKSDSITLLLPLCLVSENKVDLALVVSRGDGGYLAETIYPLDWAYKCARLICRPDSDWLTPSTITNSSVVEDNN